MVSSANTISVDSEHTSTACNVRRCSCGRQRVLKEQCVVQSETGGEDQRDQVKEGHGHTGAVQRGDQDSVVKPWEPARAARASRRRSAMAINDDQQQPGDARLQSKCVRCRRRVTLRCVLESSSTVLRGRCRRRALQSRRILTPVKVTRPCSSPPATSAESRWRRAASRAALATVAAARARARHVTSERLENVRRKAGAGQRVPERSAANLRRAEFSAVRAAARALADSVPRHRSR